MPPPKRPLACLLAAVALALGMPASPAAAQAPGKNSQMPL
jgi:hypothetical protein